jgi:hypothetical protein
MCENMYWLGLQEYDIWQIDTRVNKRANIPNIRKNSVYPPAPGAYAEIFHMYHTAPSFVSAPHRLSPMPLGGKQPLLLILVRTTIP